MATSAIGWPPGWRRRMRRRSLVAAVRIAVEAGVPGSDSGGVEARLGSPRPSRGGGRAVVAGVRHGGTEQVLDVIPGTRRALAHDCAVHSVHQDEIGRNRDLELVPGRRGHDRRNRVGGEFGDPTVALLRRILGDYHGANVGTGHLGARAEGLPEGPTRRAAARQKGDEYEATAVPECHRRRAAGRGGSADRRRDCVRRTSADLQTVRSGARWLSSVEGMESGEYLGMGSEQPGDEDNEQGDHDSLDDHEGGHPSFPHTTGMSPAAPNWNVPVAEPEVRLLRRYQVPFWNQPGRSTPDPPQSPATGMPPGP